MPSTTESRRAGANNGRDAQRRRAEIAPGKPGSWSWWDLPWERDPHARGVVRRNPDGMTLQEVGDLWGVSRERIRQIEDGALRKLEFRARIGALPREWIVELFERMRVRDE